MTASVTWATTRARWARRAACVPPRNAALSTREGSTRRWQYTREIANATVATTAVAAAKASVSPFTSIASGRGS